jgi:hypothetical protein
MLMQRVLFSTAAVVSVLLLSSCSEKISPVSQQEIKQTGALNLSVSLDRAGALKKTSALDLSELLITLSSPELETIRDTVALSGGYHRREITRAYSQIAARIKDQVVVWHLAVESRDRNNRTIHSADTSFSIQPLDTFELSMQLAAQYSMLNANFFPIRDSVTECRVYVDNEIIGRSSFAKQTRIGDTAVITYDYLTASPSGISHSIRLDVMGNLWGIDTLLYTGDTAITIRSGENSTTPIRLKYVGPDTLHGAASMTVTLGTPGIVTINGILQPRSDVEPFYEYFSDSVLSSDWTVRQGYGTYSLTAQSGFLHYDLHGPRAYSGWTNNYQDNNGWSPSLEIARTFNGTQWKLSAKVRYRLRWAGTGAQGPTFWIVFGDNPRMYLQIDRIIDEWYSSNVLGARLVDSTTVAENATMIASDDVVTNDWLDHTYWYEITRNGQEIIVSYSTDGVNYSEVLSGTLQHAAQSSQKIILDGSVWTTAGSFAEWDYITVK